MRERLIDGYFRFLPNSMNGSSFQPSYVPFHVEQPLEASLVKMFRTMNWPSGLKFFWRKQTKAFHFASCLTIAAARFDELLQPWTTQWLIMPQEHARNNYLKDFRRSKYTYISQ